MTDALIGHTGFVGANILAGSQFDALYNSKNIEDIAGRSHDTIVCAGVSAVKWLANKQPQEDWAAIERLLGCLKQVRANRFVLISTVDVYQQPNGKTERDIPADDHPEAYGRHRRAIERFVEQNFPDHLIVRLPALFGPGLKKNAIYDLMHDNIVDKINPAGRFQWYPVARIAADLDRMREAGVRLVNVAVEPLATREIFSTFFPQVDMPPETLPAPSYDMHTELPQLLGGHGAYHLRKPEIMDAMGRFIATEKS